VIVRDAGTVATPGFLFETADVGRPRLDCARERIARLNPDVVVTADGDGVPLPACADLPAAAQAALAVVRTLLCG
jgi:molybdopterin/thiamine biosynthesis adenylyltransferase